MRSTRWTSRITVLTLTLALAAGCVTRPTNVNPELGQPYPTATGSAVAAPVVQPVANNAPPTEADVTVEYTLRTQIGGDPAMAFVGVGGAIDGLVNPMLEAEVGDVVAITLVNSDPVLHDFTVSAFNATTGELTQAGQEGRVIFRVTAPGDFEYICSVPGHREAGMKGTLRITGELAVGDAGELTNTSSVAGIGGGDMDHELLTTAANPAAQNAAAIIRHPADLPAPVGDRPPQTLHIEMETVEVTGQLADGTTYSYFTFDGKVPGPFLRIRVGDTVEFVLRNHDGSLFPHSIDLHAVTGPGGGAVFTQTNPGESTSFSFRALQPGLYVYHCATASIPHHIQSGMYGLILVEPEGGLPPVDREFYVMQGEIYTAQPYGAAGHLEFSGELMSSEEPQYFVFNGAAGGLTQDDYALRAEVGDTVRIFFGVGGPNFISSFHVIGEIFDRVYDQASLTSPPLTDVQTTLVPPGGATMVEFTVDVPGRYILVDHALSRLEHGLVAFLYVEGEENPDIFHGEGLGEGTGH